MQAVLDWMSSPAATNWFSLVSAFAAILAAIFAGLGLWLAVRRGAGRLYIEWDDRWADNDGRIPMRGELVNKLDETVILERVELRPRYHQCLPSGKDTKHQSWPVYAYSLRGEAAPSRQVAFHFTIAPDWPALDKARRKPIHRIDQFFKRSLWRLGIRRYSRSFGVPISIIVTVRRKTSNSRITRLMHTERVNDATIAAMAAKVPARTMTATEKS